jgi:hypothetical protein
LTIHFQERALLPFVLEKWYLDVVTDEGDAAILYCATLGWRGLRLEYGSVLTLEGGQAQQQSSLGSYSVQSDDAQISAAIPHLKSFGQWQQRSTPYSQTVYQDGSGEVRWECLQPCSEVEVCVGARLLAGRGYAERLTLTLPPWKLPLMQLRWGRYVAAEGSCVWIDWQGPYTNRIALVNGERRALRKATETDVEMDGAHLAMCDGQQLRAGRLGETVLPSLPSLASLVPLAMLGVTERKWRSRGELVQAGQRSNGWAIHEVVDWKH